jgi:hypothetical protein
MTYAESLRKALITQLTPSWITFMSNWDQVRSTPWRGGGKPAAIVLHHTAAAATSSVNPGNPGNQRGANDGVINFIQNHYAVPAANFTLDRDGRVYVHAAYPIWHAGLGSFTGKAPWKSLGIPDNLGNNYMLGVEVMSKGLKKDWTVAQQDTLVFLMRACRDASGWSNIGLLRRPQHKDWTTRKIDTKYTNAEIGDMISTYGFVA